MHNKINSCDRMFIFQGPLFLTIASNKKYCLVKLRADISCAYLNIKNQFLKICKKWLGILASSIVKLNKFAEMIGQTPSIAILLIGHPYIAL